MKNNCKHAADLIPPNGNKNAVVIKAALKEASEALRKTAGLLDDLVFECNLASTEKL